MEQLFPPDGDTYAPRYVDKLVKVFTRQPEKEAWILVLIEVQGYNDNDFAERMFQYYYRILDKYGKSITAFAIFTDSGKAFHPKHYEKDFLGTGIYYGFNTYKIIDQNDAELEASNNPFALAVLSAKLAISGNKLEDQQWFDLAYNLAKRLLAKKIPKEKIRKVMNFLRYYLHFDNQEMITKFEQEIAILTKRKIPMGIEEFLLDRAGKKGIEKGIEEGRQEEKKETAVRMKKNGLDKALISNITGLLIEDIEKF